MIRWFDIARHERGLLFRGRDFVKVLQPGRHVYFDLLRKLRVEVEDVTQPRIESERLDVIVGSGALKDEAVIVDLDDGKRALVWIEGRLEAMLRPGLYAFWKAMKDIRVEVLDATKVRFETPSLSQLLALRGASDLVELVNIDPRTVGLYFLNGELQEALPPGRYAFWKGEGRVEVRRVDLREQVLDVSGQEIMTRDKVTLRLNAVLTYTVTDPEKCAVTFSDFVQAIYREVQLALRAAIGTRELDALLSEKDLLSEELARAVAPRLAEMGIALGVFGIRDVILPGEMKDLLNKVTEAKKAAEANLVTRREEVAAVRSQLNAARLIESNPTLMRLRELEVLEKISEKAKLNVVLGESGGLANAVVKLL